VAKADGVAKEVNTIDSNIAPGHDGTQEGDRRDKTQ